MAPIAHPRHPLRWTPRSRGSGHGHGRAPAERRGDTEAGRRGHRRCPCRSRGPRPVPGMARSSALPARKNRSNSRSRSSSEIPMPESDTVSTATSPSDAASVTPSAALVGRELDRVRDQVREHLGDPVGVDDRGDRRVGQDRPPAAACGRSPPGCGSGRSGARARTGRSARGGSPSARSRGPESVSRSLMSASRRRALWSMISRNSSWSARHLAHLAVHQDVRVAQDRRERRAQLVRHARDEVGLELVGQPQRLDLLGERGVQLVEAGEDVDALDRDRGLGREQARPPPRRGRRSASRAGPRPRAARPPGRRRAAPAATGR